MNKTILVAVALVVVLGVGGFLVFGNRSSSTPNPTESSTTTQKTEPTTTAEAANSLVTENFKFSPASITVKAGATITFTNKDSVSHSVTSDEGISFDTGLIPQGQTTTFTAPTKAGTYAFHCSLHTSMKGTLVVE